MEFVAYKCPLCATQRLTFLTDEMRRKASLVVAGGRQVDPNRALMEVAEPDARRAWNYSERGFVLVAMTDSDRKG